MIAQVPVAQRATFQGQLTDRWHKAWSDMAKNPNSKKPRERLQTKRRTDEDRIVLVRLQGLRD